MPNQFESCTYIKPERKEYKFFEEEKERKEIFEYSKKIAEYLRKGNIPNLVVIDRSSRPLYIGVKEYLDKKYPDEKMANIYFMNPKGFKAKEEMTEYEIEEIIDDCAWKQDVSESPEQVRSKGEILKELEETYKKLMLDKDKPLLIFDTCIHSGDSLAPVKKTLKELGFSDIRIGAINPSDRGSKVKTDFYVTKQEPEKGCYPFGRDRIIEKTFNHVYSQRTEDSGDSRKRERSIELRREIKDIMQDYLAK